MLMRGGDRFHAWQSSLLFSAIFIVHLIFSLTAVLSWMLFVVDMALIAFLSFRAYKDGAFKPLGSCQSIEPD